MRPASFPLARTHGLVVRTTDDGETLVYDQDSTQAVCLDELSAAVWALCDGTRTPEAVQAALPADAHPAAAAVALEQLRSSDLLVPETLGHSRLEGLSRRQMMRDLGIAAAASVPIVFAIATPSAAGVTSLTCTCSSPDGADARPEGCACVNNNQCCGVCIGGTSCGPTPTIASGLGPYAPCCPPNPADVGGPN